jgi:hypothetical protein
MKNKGTKKYRKRKNRSLKQYKMRGGKQPAVFIDLHEGLGNQLFIYAAGLAEKLKRNTELYIMPATNNTHTTTDYRPLLFKRGIPITIGSDEHKRISTAVTLYENIDRFYNGIDKSLEHSNKDVILSRKWYQQYEHIAHVIPQIRQDCFEYFEKTYPDQKSEISSSDTAFMHIRRGDYLGHGNETQIDYYKRALEKIDADKSIKYIYILSDDLEWCKKEKWPTKKTILGLDQENKDELRALYIMSLCLAGAIIAPSTFSSWGVILGADQNPESTIVYPLDWTTNVYEPGKAKRMKFPERWNAL